MSATLPRLFEKWTRDAFGGSIEGEPEAQCSKCRMVASPPEIAFDASVKCCSHTPTLPNFLVGSILKASDASFAAGRDSLLRRIASRSAVTPLSVGVSEDVLARAQEAKKAGLFGKRADLRCPHYIADDAGSCGIWPFREAVCSTFFCHQERGLVGFRFWRALERLLFIAQDALARHAVMELGISEHGLQILFPPDTQLMQAGLAAPSALRVANPNSHLYEAAWSPFAGREIEYYQSCSDLVEALPWERVLEIGGLPLRTQAKLVEGRLRARMDGPNPTLVQLGRAKTRISEDRAIIQTYTAYRTFDLDASLVHGVLLAASAFIAPVPLADARSAIETQLHRPITTDEERMLFEAGMLIPVP